MSGLYDGAEVVLGPNLGLDLPPEQQFINQKMRPGSGVLSVQVLPDGPTRVLQVHAGFHNLIGLFCSVFAGWRIWILFGFFIFID